LRWLPMKLSWRWFSFFPVRWMSKWIPLVDAGPASLGEREGHCATMLVVERREVIVCFGGYCEGDYDECVYIATWDERNLPLVSWSVAATAPLASRDGATLCLWRDVGCADRGVCFGGLGPSYTPQSTLFVVTVLFHADRGTYAAQLCELTSAGATPEPRWRHSASIASNRMIVFGGCTESREQANDVHVLDLDTMVWTEVLWSPDAVPSPRFLAAWVPISCAESDLASLVLYGGAHFINGQQFSCSDLWLLTLTGHSTSGSSIVGCLLADDLPPVNGHSACAARGGPLVSFFSGKDFAEGHDDLVEVRVSPGPTAEWARRVIGSPAPHYRYTAATAHTSSGGTVLIAGQCRHPDPVVSYFLSP
jgi:hypothetical protein